LQSSLIRVSARSRKPFAAVGFGVAVVVLLRAVELAGAGLGWWIVVPAAAALALSLVKRVPDITLGLPFLLVWHAHEAKALIRRRPARS
jgi:hypothetical protein